MNGLGFGSDGFSPALVFIVFGVLRTRRSMLAGHPMLFNTELRALKLRQFLVLRRIIFEFEHGVGFEPLGCLRLHLKTTELKQTDGLHQLRGHGSAKLGAHIQTGSHWYFSARAKISADRRCWHSVAVEKILAKTRTN